MRRALEYTGGRSDRADVWPSRTSAVIAERVSVWHLPSCSLPVDLRVVVPAPDCQSPASVSSVTGGYCFSGHKREVPKEDFTRSY